MGTITPRGTRAKRTRISSAPSMTAIRRRILLSTFLSQLIVLGGFQIVAPATIAAAVEDAAGGRFDSASLGLHLSWPAELTQVSPSELSAQGAAMQTVALLLRSKNGEFPTLNLIEVPGRFELSRATETVADSYRSVGLTDTAVQSAEILSTGWAELVLAYRGGMGPALSYVLVIPRADSHLILTLVGRADAAEQNRTLWRSIVSSIQVDPETPAALERGQATTVPPVWLVVLTLSAAALAVSVVWHRRARR